MLTMLADKGKTGLLRGKRRLLSDMFYLSGEGWQSWLLLKREASYLPIL